MKDIKQKMYYIYRDGKFRYTALERKAETSGYGEIVNLIHCNDKQSFIRQCLMYNIPDKNIKYMVEHNLEGLAGTSDLVEEIKVKEKEYTNELEELLLESRKRTQELTDKIDFTKKLREYVSSVSNGKHSQGVVALMSRVIPYNPRNEELDDETLSFIEKVLEKDYRAIKEQGMMNWQLDNGEVKFKTYYVKGAKGEVKARELNEEDYQLTLAKNIGGEATRLTLYSMKEGKVQEEDNICVYYTIADEETFTSNYLAHDIVMIYEMITSLSKNQRANLIKGYNNFLTKDNI